MHSGKYALPLSKEIIIGWPETFIMAHSALQPIAAASLFANVVYRELLFLERFKNMAAQQFMRLDDYGFPLGKFPYDLADFRMARRVSPLRMTDVRLQIRNSGFVPRGMKAGERFKLSVIFVAEEPEDEDEDLFF